MLILTSCTSVDATCKPVLLGVARGVATAQPSWRQRARLHSGAGREEQSIYAQHIWFRGTRTDLVCFWESSEMQDDAMMMHDASLFQNAWCRMAWAKAAKVSHEHQTIDARIDAFDALSHKISKSWLNPRARAINFLETCFWDLLLDVLATEMPGNSE